MYLSVPHLLDAFYKIIQCSFSILRLAVANVYTIAALDLGYTVLDLVNEDFGFVFRHVGRLLASINVKEALTTFSSKTKFLTRNS